MYEKRSADSSLGAKHCLPVAIVALLAAAVLFDSASSWLRGWQPSGGYVLFVCIVGAAGAGFAGSLLVLVASAGRRWLRAHWSQLTLVVFSTGTAVVAAEWGVGRHGELFGLPTPHSRGAFVEKQFEPRPDLLPGIQGTKHYTTNSLGIRGPEVQLGSEVLRVLSVGGSTTEEVYLDDTETWPVRLGLLLGRMLGREVWAGSLAISGYTSVEHLDLLSRPKLPGEPGVVVLTLGLNDFLRSLNGSLDRGTPPRWRNSSLVRLAYDLHRRAFLRRLLYLQEDPAAESLIERRRRRARADRVAQLPELAEYLADFEARVRSLAHHCRRLGARCYFVSQPTAWTSGVAGADVESLWWLGELEGGAFLVPSALRAGMDRFNEALIRTCETEGMGCLDLRDLDGRSQLFYDDCHFNELGSSVVADRVATELASSLSKFEERR